AIYSELECRIPLRDGTRLAADVFRPYAAGRFPALVAPSPYTRQLQRTNVPIGQNEAGITEFWVPRGYAHVVVDVRGTNDSEGSYDLFGSQEQQDLFDIIEWMAEQPWCDGNIGMTGCSYFGRAQLMAAAQQPPHLKAIFPHDASCDYYRDAIFHGGIPSGFVEHWTGSVSALNLMSGRLKDPEGMLRHWRTLLTREYPFDGPYYQERSAGPRLHRIQVPTYFSTGWYFYHLHLRGAFDGWEGTGDIPKRMFLGPRPVLRRPFAVYHQEALRWYDHWLKGLDTRVMEGPPIQLYIQGEDCWRGEQEWPLARTQWRELFLGGPADGHQGTLEETPGADRGRSFSYDPASPEALHGRPRLTYTSEPLERELEVTGPIAVTLTATSTATDTDWFVWLLDEAPDGTTRELTRGWLRASHRELDPARSKSWQPYHPHTRAQPLTPGEPYELAIEVWPTCNLFKPGHRIRLEIGSCDDAGGSGWGYMALPIATKNTVLEGSSARSRLLLPVIPH
ncbi:MAG: CocE/NonD family hydrolase, partial [Dehalococcoidia bacterium]